MLHNDFKYRGQDLDDCVFVCDDFEHGQMLKYATKQVARSYLWSEVRSTLPLKLKGAKCLVIRGKTIDELPKWLSDCSSLEYLEIPGRLAPCLLPNLSRKLATLEISGQSKVTLKQSLLSKSIIRMVAQTDVKFNCSAFPELKHFLVKSDSRYSMFSKLYAEGVHLGSAIVSPLKSFQKLRIYPDDLKYLGIVGGMTDSLDEIEQYRQLTNLRLHNLPKLRSLEPLNRLQNLKELSIGYCNKLTDLESLAKIPKLEKLEFYGCSALNLHSYTSFFKSLNLNELIV